MWLSATKANYDCTVDRMLEGGFILPMQIMFVPHMICKIMVLQCQGKSCFAHGLNVRKLPWSAKTKTCRCRELNVSRWFCGQGQVFCTLRLK